ncbi:MAG: NADH-quinone oxidoreductase subunit H [Bacteroidota bacterium]|nr:NADH-quinone oxidoreductase subunit H [Bacteroidota bacterium]
MLIIVLAIISSLFYVGILNRTRSIVSGRKGPKILQPIYDILKLLKKGSVYSETTSIIFKIAPAVNFACVVMALLIIPFGSHKGIISFDNDFVLFAYILALGKFMSIISALDTGSSFEGMGAAREALYSMLVEPAFFILMGSFALASGDTSFYSIFNSIHLHSYISYLLSILAALVLLLIILVENSRVPVDDPRTHLELTMIHEVMILDNSGFDLGLILYTSILKFIIYGSLIINFFIDFSTPTLLTIVIFLAGQSLIAIIIGLIESFTARFRMNHNPQFIFAITSMAMILFFCILLLKGLYI